MGLDPENVNGRTIFAQAAQGNAYVQEVLDDWMADICAGLTGLIHIFNPELVLIGGGVSEQKELFVEPVREKVLSMIMPEFAQGLRIEAAELGNNAGMLGAVATLLA